MNEWNRKAAEIVGYSKDDVMGKDLVETYITAEFQASVRSVLAKALQGEQTDNYEFPLYTKGGERVEVAGAEPEALKCCKKPLPPQRGEGRCKVE